MSGRGDEVIDVAKTNLLSRQVRFAVLVGAINRV
jgi:hypothetical protein